MTIVPFIFVKRLFRSIKNKNYRQRWSERFGNTNISLKSSIWIHSVSVGESIAIAPLVKKMLKEYPNDSFVITTMTPTGSDIVCQLYKDNENVYHTYIPFDIQSFIEEFISKINPKIMIIMETELWPNIINSCHQKNIPVILTNARLSYKSFRGYMKFPFAINNMISQISHINAQAVKDGKRFINLGINPNKVTITGNLKYNLSIPDDINELTFDIKKSVENRLVWIAASTHKGEEEIVLKAHKIILEKLPNALLILVPRHKERFDEVANLIDKLNFSFERRTQAKEQIKDNTNVYLADTMGELLKMYNICDIAFVGGSLFDENGGHNLLEPACLSKAIISGESLFNFHDIANDLIKKNGLIKVKNGNELSEKIIDLFSNEQKLKEYSKNSYKVFEQNQNVVNNQLEQIKKFLR